MRKEARERGVVDDSLKNIEYLPYITTALDKLISDGGKLPEVRKITGPTQKIQITAHLRIADALQGYWERHKKIYVHRSKSDYKILYNGAIMVLKEEELQEGRDNSEEISKLEALIKEKEHKHKINQELSLIKCEVKKLLEERSENIISEEEFNRSVEEMISVFSYSSERIRIGKIVDKIVDEENTRMKNRQYQNKHRHFEKIAKGFSVVE